MIQKNSWFIDSGCTNQMTYNPKLLKELDTTIISGQRRRSDDYTRFNMFEGHHDCCFYVPDIDQNLPSIGQSIDKRFKIIFENKWCLIKDVRGKDIFQVKMNLNLVEDQEA